MLECWRLRPANVRNGGQPCTGLPMIKAISFDFYNTLVRFWPGLEEIQQVACWELGINVSKEGIGRGYSKADVYFNRAN